MIIDKKILDELSAKAKASERLRMAYDLRTTPDDGSQRMLSAIEPGTQVPIHRHRNTSETVLCIRGHFKQLLYDEAGNVTDEIDMLPGGCIVNIPVGKWHNIQSLESGTIMFECKDGKYAPFAPEDVLEMEEGRRMRAEG